MAAVEVNNLTISSGMELKVKGVVRGHASRFAINIGHSKENIALHFNPRFHYAGDHNTIVMNTKVASSWQKEERSGSFPFEEKKEFKVSIHFDFDTFNIYLSNGDMVQFPNRLGDKKYRYIFFGGDAKIEYICVKPSERPSKR